ncbi:MAG TPA: hypothetical protein VGA80_14950 [Flavobacteriaceae bacterium]|jgi:hypothetical protein
MKRKTFLKKTAGALLLAVPAYSLMDCSSSDDDSNNPNPNPNPSGNCLQNGTNSSIGTNHGHTLTVSVADINAGTQKTYNIQGSATHPHEVTLTAADFNALSTNTSIVKTSTTDDSHSHSVTVSCA